MWRLMERTKFATRRIHKMPLLVFRSKSLQPPPPAEQPPFLLQPLRVAGYRPKMRVIRAASRNPERPRRSPPPPPPPVQGSRLAALITLSLGRMAAHQRRKKEEERRRRKQPYLPYFTFKSTMHDQCVRTDNLIHM
jgi:hypothetical protein